MGATKPSNFKIGDTVKCIDDNVCMVSGYNNLNFDTYNEYVIEQLQAYFDDTYHILVKGSTQFVHPEKFVKVMKDMEEIKLFEDYFKSKNYFGWIDDDNYFHCVKNIRIDYNKGFIPSGSQGIITFNYLTKCRKQDSVFPDIDWKTVHNDNHVLLHDFENYKKEIKMEINRQNMETIKLKYDLIEYLKCLPTFSASNIISVSNLRKCEDNNTLKFSATEEISTNGSTRTFDNLCVNLKQFEDFVRSQETSNDSIAKDIAREYKISKYNTEMSTIAAFISKALFGDKSNNIIIGLKILDVTENHILSDVDYYIITSLNPPFAENTSYRFSIKKYEEYKKSLGAERPPLGLKPKSISERNYKINRFNEVCEAISKYYNAGEKIPIEWVEEHNELVGFVKANI